MPKKTSTTRFGFVVGLILVLAVVSKCDDYIIPWTAAFFYLGPGDNSTSEFFCPFENDTEIGHPPSVTGYYLCIPNQEKTIAMNLGDRLVLKVDNDIYKIKAVNSFWNSSVVFWSSADEPLPATMVGNETLTSGQNVTFSPPSNGVLYLMDVSANKTGLMFAKFNITCSNGKSRCTNEIQSSSSEYVGWEVNYSKFISWLTLIFLWISIGGALMTILTFTVHHEIRTYPIKLIMYLCVSIIVGNFFFLMAFEGGFQKDDALCFITGATVHGFFLANLSWTFCIAINFHQMIVKRNRESENLEKWYHLGAWGFPVFCVEWTAGFLKYGDTGGACYINNNIFIFVFFFFPALCIVASNTILFIFVGREIRETLASAPKTDKREWTKELRVYISITISIGLSWIFGFIMVIFTVTVINFIFLTLFTIFTCLQGFLIFVFYCVNFKVLGKWAGLIGKCIPFFRRFENMESRRTTSSGRTGTSRSTSRMNSGASGTSMNSMDSGDSSSAD